MKDIGRIGISIAAMLLNGTEKGLTAAALTAACRTDEVSSPGRVSDYLNYCYQHGEITAEAGPGHWTRRRLILGPGFFRHFSTRARIDIDTLSPVAPELASARSLTEDEPSFLHYSICTGGLMGSRPDLFRTSPSKPPYMFNKRIGGMLMLYDLLASQPPDRERLLEEAPLSRAALSRRFGVSRVHVNAMLAEAGEAGLLSCPAPDQVVFSQLLSDAMERHYALFIQLTRAGAQFALATLPNRPARDTLKAGPASL